jgi:hypothetical protein
MPAQSKSDLNNDERLAKLLQEKEKLEKKIKDRTSYLKRKRKRDNQKIQSLTGRVILEILQNPDIELQNFKLKSDFALWLIDQSKLESIGLNESDQVFFESYVLEIFEDPGSKNENKKDESSPDPDKSEEDGESK